jgi:parallel beta-helix repeat protein
VNRKFGNAIVSGLALVFAICIAASANAAITYVGTCTGALIHYPTIQQGVNASAAGGTVKVCPGTYPEQVEIKKNLTLEGFTVGTSNQVVVAAPGGGVVANTTSLATGNPIAAQIYVHDAASVTVTDVVVDGAGNGFGNNCGAPDLIGIYYQDASGLVNQVVARNQTASPANGCQWGLGIFVQSGVSLVTHNAGTSTVTVENSSVHDFMKNGITGNEVGTALTVTSNEIRGQGSTTGAAENGIQLGFGATGKVTSNTVIDEIWAPDTSSDPGDAAAGILVYDVAGSTVSSNHVGGTQFGIAVVGDGGTPADNATISSNVLDGTLIFDGIDVCGSSGGTISSNIVTGSTQSGIHLDGTCAPVASGGTTVSSNVINEACAGILNGTAGNTLSPASTFFNTVNTILVGDVCPAAPNADIARLASSSQDVVRPHPARP